MSKLRVPWSKDPDEINKAIEALLAGHLPVSLQLGTGECLQSRVVKLYVHNGTPYLLLQAPDIFAPAEQIQKALFKMAGLPILGFDCKVVKQSQNLLAVPYPKDLFLLELRKSGRIDPMPGSMATFFIQARSRVSICHMENISMHGVKLIGNPAHQVQTGSLIGPCTLSLAGRDALIAREVTISKAQIVRLKANDGKVGQMGLGMRFELSKIEERQLQEHIEFLKQQ